MQKLTYCDAVLKMDDNNVNRIYHDHFYGFPITDDDELFGRLILEINQADPEDETSNHTEIKYKDPDLKDAAAKAEYETIMNVLKEVNFNKTKAAEILKIDRKTLYNKIKIYESL